MNKLHFNEKNKPYYSEGFIKGFECGVERQFNADRDAYKQGFNDAIEKAMNESYTIHLESGIFKVVQYETLLGLAMAESEDKE